MVFGWGKKRSTDAIESTQLAKQISLDEIEGILQEKKDNISNEIIEKSKSIRDKIETDRKKIIQLFSQFESDDLGTQDVDKHLKIIIERGKNAVISGVRKETTKKLDEIKKYQDVVNLNSEVAQLLKRIGDILGPNSRVMHVFARKYADKLKEILADITKTKAELQKLVNEYDKLDFGISNISEWSKKIIDSKKDNEVKNNIIVNTKVEIQNRNRTIQSLEEDIKNLKSSNIYIEFLNIKKELESLEVEKDRIKHEMDFQFSKISRPLGKYSYVSSLEKPLKLVMEKMNENPYDVITNETKNAVIEVLQAVIKSVVAGNVSVKDTDKSVEQIEETITRLDEYLKLKNDLANNKNALEQKIQFNSKDLEEKEKNFTRTKERKAQLESEIANLENQINETTKLKPQIAKNIESKLSEILGTKFTIT
jgi:predicted  nucleic acid-binding Zn-ribbon protein